MTPLDRLQNWYLKQCDGDWEHGAGIQISTIDNPGWRISIPLQGTSVEGRLFERREHQKDAKDWHQIWVKDEVFNAACDPSRLEFCLSVFCDWVDAKDS